MTLSRHLNSHANLGLRKRIVHQPEEEKPVKKHGMLSTSLISKSLPSTSTTAEPVITTASTSASLSLDNVVVINDIIDFKVPTKTNGYLYNTWKLQYRAVNNNVTDLTTFAKELIDLGLELDERLDSCDDGTATIQSITSAVVVVTGAIETAITATDALDAASYKIFQSVLAGVIAALGALAKAISSKLTTLRDETMTLKEDVLNLLDDESLSKYMLRR